MHNPGMVVFRMNPWFRGGLGLLMCAGIVCSAADWPAFLGPNRDGTSTETGLLSELKPGGPKVIWSRTVGTGYSAPSVRDGQLVLHHRVANEEVVEAFHADTGALVWRHAYPSRFVDPYGYNNGPRCSPLLTETACYTFGAEGRLLCLDRKTGKRVWEVDTAKKWKIPAAFFGVGSTPILEENLLIVMIGGQPNAGVVAFDPATAAVRWESVGRDNWEGVPMTGARGDRTVSWKDYEKQASYATPVAATIGGKRRLFCLMRQGLVLLEPRTGDVEASFYFRSQVNESVNAACPVVRDGRVFLSNAYYRTGSVLLNVDDDPPRFSEVWRAPVLEIHWNTPIYHEGHLYAFSGRNEPDARFRCVEYATGKLKWDRDERWRRGGAIPNVYGRGSAIAADGRLIVLGEAGLLGLFELNPERDVELSRWQVPEIGYPAWTAPVLADKRLYLRDEDSLLCLDFAGAP